MTRRKTRSKRSKKLSRRHKRKQRGGEHPEEQYNPVVTYKQKTDKIADPDSLNVTTSYDAYAEDKAT